MIVTEGLTTTVKFGIPEKGNVAITAHDPFYFGGDGRVIIQEIMPEVSVKVGSTLQKEQAKELPKIMLEFQCEESINVMIKALEMARQNLKYPQGMCCLAC